MSMVVWNQFMNNIDLGTNMNVYFIGCLHLGHTNIAKARGFVDSEHHDTYLINQWNSVVRKKDLVWILGDITMEKPSYYPLLNELMGRKKVVLGNHDLPQHTRELLNYVETVAGATDYQGFMLTHIPIHPNEVHFWRGNIHAHIHENELHEVEIMNRYNDIGSKIEPTKDKYHCVDAAKLNFTPKTIEQLLAK